MQQCPKCGRTYQDDNQKFCTFDGGRLGDASASGGAPTIVDLNKTVQANFPPPPPGQQGVTAPITPPDLGRTIAGGPPTPTSEFQGHVTGPTQGPTSSALQPPASAPLPSSAPLPQPPVQSAPLPASAQGVAAQPAKKSGKLPLILGGAAVLLLLGLGAGGALIWFMMNRAEKSTGSGTSINTRTDEKANANSSRNANSGETAAASPGPAATPPPDANRFVSANNNLNSLLAQHFVDFSFYYPKTWELDPKAGGEGSSNFVKVERHLPPDFTQENFAVGYYESNGTVEADRPIFPSLVKSFNTKLTATFPEYKKLSEGETKINSIDGYEFRFQSISRGTEKGDITIWGRVVFLPPGTDGDKRGVTLLMLATSVAPELKSIDDVGVRGELPVILNSFKLGQ
ncbi:MAG TPA: hypothetical protein VF735_17170 [Pyrinomonadaceae bacterium]|jgi:hypothetical protein